MYASGIISCFSNKAQAMQYAIAMTATSTEEGSKINYEEAQKLFDFICKNVDFTDSKLNDLLDEAIRIAHDFKEGKMQDLYKSLDDALEKLKKEYKDGNFPPGAEKLDMAFFPHKE